MNNNNRAIHYAEQLQGSPHPQSFNTVRTACGKRDVAEAVRYSKNKEQVTCKECQQAFDSSY